MKKISIMILLLVIALASCKKTPEVNLKYVDVERDLITVGTTTATVQCDYEYITTLKKAFFYYGEGEDETDMSAAEMRMVQNTLYVDLTGLKENTTYSYYYEFVNGFNSMRTKAKTFKTEVSPVTPPAITLPTVVTAAVTEITTNSAKSGGEVTNNGGAEVTERGICWSTNANPTITDSHVASGSGTGTFTSTLTGLAANTTYHVRAYAINEKGTAYGLDKEFKTLSSGGGGGEHEYVDLGLPSGTLWATCNVGANSPEDSGDYFAWGETQPKDYYDWNTYQHCAGSEHTLTKYCSNSSWGYNGFTDNLTTLLPEDDAATANWGTEWRMPTKAEWDELCNNTTSTWTTQNGVNGRLFTASNGKSLFLPAAGDWVNDNNLNVDGGFYWSNSLNIDYTFYAWNLYFSSGICFIGGNGDYRNFGFSIRPVRSQATPPPSGDVPIGAINGLFSVSPTQKVYFSQGNLQYQSSTNTWRFAENQWDYVGNETQGTVYENGVKCNNSLISSTYNGWMDLFGWGTSGYHDSSDPFNVNYMPWSTSVATENTSYNYFGYGPSIYMESVDLTGSSANYDWGVYNPIDNGGNTTNQWRTLTQPEWHYVLNTRNTTSDIRYAKANVNNVNGLILLPDNWNSSIYNLSNTNNSHANYSSNIISASQWAVIESAGAVFMPSTGLRIELLVDFSPDGVEFSGFYWSATAMYSSDALSVYFNDLDLKTDDWYGRGRQCGRSVRLVQDEN